MSTARLRLAVLGETMSPRRASFFWRSRGTSLFRARVPAHGRTEVGQ
jgi:hypothetical protein